MITAKSILKRISAETFFLDIIKEAKKNAFDIETLPNHIKLELSKLEIKLLPEGTLE